MIDDMFDCLVYGVKSLIVSRDIQKVVFENNYCIIVDTQGNRYIAKPEKGEKFDEEKGLLVALAKYNGFSTTKVQKLLENAVRKGTNNKKKANSK